MSRRFSLAAWGVAVLVLAAGAAAGTPAWRPLPPAPVHGRIAASVVWTGSEMLVFGGVRSGRRLADGAAYAPATRTWRLLAPPPAGVAGGGGDGAAWTGRTMVVFTGNSPDGPAGAAAYDPRRDTWRKLPSGPLGVREGYVSVWTGHELLVVGGTSGDAIATPVAAALDPRTSTWRVLQAFTPLTGLRPFGAIWNGRRAYIGGMLNGSGVLIGFDPHTGAIHRAKLPVTPLTPVGWTGKRIVFTESADPLFSSATIRLYAPATRRWTTAPAAPCALPRSYTQSAWAGSRLVAACGTRGLQLYTPSTKSWRVLAAGPSPLNSLGWSAVTWTGRMLIAWSGTAKKPFNPAPNSGASIELG